MRYVVNLYEVGYLGIWELGAMYRCQVATQLEQFDVVSFELDVPLGYLPLNSKTTLRITDAVHLKIRQLLHLLVLHNEYDVLIIHRYLSAIK